MTTIEKIKAEVERLKEENRKIKCQANERYCSGYDDAFYDLVPFIDSLESEKPMEDGLEEEIKRYGKEEMPVVLESDLNDIARHFAEWGKEQGYREGFLEGAKIQREEDDQLYETFTTTNDLEEAAKKYALDTAEDSEQYSARYLGYKDGAKWQKEQDDKELSDLLTIAHLQGAEQMKEQMMKELSEKIASAYQLGLSDKEKQMLKEARNHFVYNILSGNDMKKMIELYNDEVSCKPGDVVRIIILKQE